MPPSVRERTMERHPIHGVPPPWLAAWLAGSAQRQSGGTGVYGRATDGGTGVLGNGATGRGVVGVVSDETAANVGVMGESFSSHGTGVRGWAAGDATGVLG